MTSLPPDPLVAAIAARLPQARWFAGKGQGIEAVSLVDGIPLPDAATLAIVDVASGGESARYVVAVDAGAADMTTTPAFARWLIDTVWAGAAQVGGRGRVIGHAVGPLPTLPAGSPTVAIIGPDASNTSCRVTVGGATFAVKLVRRCRAGIQPEVEVGAFLAERASWRGTPRLCGWLDYEPADGGPATTLASVHEFALGCDVGWDRLLGLLRADGGVSPRVLAIIDILAGVTAEMHAALASRSDVAAFAPVFPSAADRHSQAHALAAHADAVCRLIAEPGPRVAPQIAPQIAARLRAVAARRADLVSRLDSVAKLDSGAAAIRVHGDYHLGQVLLTSGDQPLVIDFEGEPGRSLDERRAKTSACKDVAGMCRSLDYLLRCAARDGGPAYAAAAAANLQQRYVDGYASCVSGQPWWPARPADADALLAAYVLDKALYELAYELQNRPTWIEVPLAAVEALLVPP
ncbi:MAG: phosphotransferase [Planctomycetaceae bacterium]